MSAEQLIRDIEALGVVLSFNAYKVDLSAPDKDTGARAVQMLNQRGRLGGIYQAVVDMVRTRAAFSWNIPPDPCEGEACNRFRQIAELRAVALVEGLCLYRAGQTIIPMAEAPYSAHKLESVAYCAGIIGAVKPYLMEHAGEFPELTPNTARRFLDQLREDWPAFQVRSWSGLTMPDSWPVEFRDAVQSAYVLALQEPTGAPKAQSRADGRKNSQSPAAGRTERKTQGRN